MLLPALGAIVAALLLLRPRLETGRKPTGKKEADA